MDRNQRTRVGDAFRERYLALGFNQASLAAAAEVSVATIRKIEKGAVQRPKAATIYHLARPLEWDARELVAYVSGERTDPPTDMASQTVVADHDRLGRLERQMDQVLSRLEHLGTTQDARQGGR